MPGAPRRQSWSRARVTACLLLLLAACAAGGAWWLQAHRGGGGAAGGDGGDEKPKAAAGEGAAEPVVARVRVAPLRRGPIERTLTVYGTAVTAPGGTRSLAFPFECRVVSVAANVGQPVAAGDPLLRVEPSADARLALDSAAGARDAAEHALADVQGRFRAHLATNQDLAAADAAARDARLKLASLQGRGPGPDGLVRAPGAGVVTRLAALPGAVVPPGGPLVDLAVENRFEARLGVAPSDAAALRAGQRARLGPVEPGGGSGSSGDGGETAGGPDADAGAGAEAATDPTELPDPPLTGTVRVVGQSVDPNTRLVDAFVTLDAPTAGSAGPAVLIGSYLRAEIVLETREALLAPRAAVLPPAAGDRTGVLFTLANGRAVRHAVRTGLDDGRNVELLPGGDQALKEGENVVTEGNYELEEGMTVRIEPRGTAAAAAKESAPETKEAP